MRKLLLFLLIMLLAGAGAYAAIVVGSNNRLPPTVNLLLGITAALIAGAGVALQLVPFNRSIGKAALHRRSMGTTSLLFAQLPPDIRDFTGRKTEIEWLRRTIKSSKRDNRIVSISALSGQGGVGKTVLAIHVAHLVRESFPDGQIYINLRGPEAEALNPNNVLESLLRELGVQPRSIPEELEARARLYRSKISGLQLLVVLDNAADEEQVRPLLPGTSPSLVLVTSRAKLANLEGIDSLRLDVLSKEESLELFERIVGNERVTREADAASELIDLCACLPLAIRLAGARLASHPHWTVNSFVNRIINHQGTLQVLDERQRAVQSNLDISFTDLDKPTADLFCRLGALTVRTFPVWLVKTIAPDSSSTAEDLLDELVRVEMLEYVGEDSIGVHRYGFHDLLREYARSKLLKDGKSTEAERVVIRGAMEAYSLMAIHADILIREPGSRHNIFPVPRPPKIGAAPVLLATRKSAVQWFASELVNILLIIQQATFLEAKLLGLDLVNCASAFCEEKSYWREWESLERFASEVAAETGNMPFQAVAKFCLGRIHHLLGEWMLSESELNEALVIARQEADRPLEAACLCALGKIRQLGRLSEALPFFLESREIYSELSDRHSVAYVTANIADIYHQLELWDESLHEFEFCLPIFQEVGDIWWEANAGIWIADVLRAQGRLSLALDQLHKSLLTLNLLEDERRSAVAVIHIARVYVDLHRPEDALQCCESAILTLERFADKWWRAMAFMVMVKAHLQISNADAAIRYANLALPAVREMGNSMLEQELVSEISIAESIPSKRWRFR